jgi:predicted component of type VI protein secretion system
MQGTGSFRLIVRRGPQPNQIYELNKDIITLGRDITNDIVINDPEVSRHHSRMTRSAGGYMLEDLGSTNGTFVNGQRLTGARQLNSGDLISLGETVTLAYESTLPVNLPEPTNQPTLANQMNQAGQPQGYGQPTPQAQPGYVQPPQAQPQPGYAQPQYGGTSQPQPQSQYNSTPAYTPPPPPPAQYYMTEQPTNQPASSGIGRWFFLGCGCLIILCIVGTVIALAYIDSQNAWCSTPLIRDVVRVLFTCP